MQIMGLTDWLAFCLFFGLPIILLCLIFLQHLLGYYLAKIYDYHFFKPPYFTHGEIAVYSAWPLSLIKYATYIIYTAYPWTLHQRRFKGQVSPYSPGKLLKSSCQAWVVLMLTSILLFPVLFIFIFILPDHA